MECNEVARICDRRAFSFRPLEGGSNLRPFFTTSTRLNQYQSTMDALLPKEQCTEMQPKHPNRTSEKLVVCVVDDDESVRESLPDLLREFGFASLAFSSAEAFLSSEFIDKTTCLILDVCMPGTTGLELHRELKLRGRQIPTIFMTAKRDEAIRARALEQGAVNFLYKPFSDMTLLEALNAAIQGK